MSDSFRHYPSPRKTLYRQRILRDFLSCWYGDKNRANAEMLRHLPGPVPLSESLRRIEEQIFSPDDLLLNKVRDKWVELAGDAVARISSPVGAKNGVLIIEVSHSAWLRELRGPVREMLKKNVDKLVGKDVCRDLNFVPAGRQRESRNSNV